MKFRKFGLLSLAGSVWLGLVIPAEAASLRTFVRAAGCWEQNVANQGPLVGSCAAHLNGDLATSAFDARADFGTIGARAIAGTARINNVINGRASTRFDDELTVNQLNGTITFAIDLAGSFSEELPDQFAVNGGASYVMSTNFAGSEITTVRGIW